MLNNIIYVILIIAFMLVGLVKPYRKSIAEITQTIYVCSAAGEILAEYHGPVRIQKKKRSDKIIISQNGKKDTYYGVTIEIIQGGNQK